MTSNAARRKLVGLMLAVPLCAAWLTAVVAAGRCDEPAVLALPDLFQTLVNPSCSHCIDEAKRRAGELTDDDRVLAWIRGKYDGGAIPHRFFLVPYRVISDTYGVFVFDPDAGFSRGYEPSLEFTFYGYRSGIMVIKHKDGTLFSALSGRAFAGPRSGQRLKPVPTLTSSWGFWKKAYPGTVAYQMFEKYQPRPLPTKPQRESQETRPPADPRLEPETEVLGVTLDGQSDGASRAYRLADLQRAGGLIADTLGQQPIVVLWQERTQTAAAYAPETDEAAQRVELTVDRSDETAPFVDSKTGSRFDIAGRAVSGKLKGQTLRWLDGTQCRWYAWAAEYPQTTIFSPPDVSSVPREARAVAPAESPPPQQAVLVNPTDVTAEHLAAWRRAGFSAIVTVLDERFAPAAYQQASAVIEQAGWPQYHWVEVGRCPALADAHPRWMAGLGMHDDWVERFPDARAPRPGEVAKAYPWVPIGYRAAFEAHVARVQQLLERVPTDFRGLLLNDLQAGPSSCGCGNVRCRWALDYHVPATAGEPVGDDAAGRFLQRVGQLAPAKELIPIWTTECDAIDLPGAPHGTGLCGQVKCAHTTCPKAFARQWQALVEGHDGAIGLLALHRELQQPGGRGQPRAAWVASPLEYVEQIGKIAKLEPIARQRLWIVVEDLDLPVAEAKTVRDIVSQQRPAMVVIARVRVDQSFVPRIIPIDATAR
ncbi:MAG: DUF3179 domain-containing protein [Pirellulales bacterium]|nr:DUF3179 domain-containing protein [Pirellulales bacterium]